MEVEGCCKKKGPMTEFRAFQHLEIEQKWKTKPWSLDQR